LHGEIQKNTQLYKSADMGRLNAYRTRSITFETVAKIRDKQAAKLLSNDHVYHRNLPVQ
jgi:hypothetical protein